MRQSTQRLRLSLGFPVVRRRSTLTISSERLRIISIHTFMFSLAVAYLLVSSKQLISRTSLIDTHGEGITTRHVFLTQCHSPLSMSFQIFLVLLQAPTPVELARTKVHPSSCLNMPPTRIQSVS